MVVVDTQNSALQSLDELESISLIVFVIDSLLVDASPVVRKP